MLGTSLPHAPNPPPPRFKDLIVRKNGKENKKDQHNINWLDRLTDGLRKKERKKMKGSGFFQGTKRKTKLRKNGKTKLIERSFMMLIQNFRSWIVYIYSRRAKRTDEETESRFHISLTSRKSSGVHRLSISPSV